MKPGLLSLLLAGAASLASAQGVASLNQSFQLRYNAWQNDREAAFSYTQASYDFSAGLPVLSYRLGAFAANGSLDYNRMASGGASDSNLGLNRYGFRVNLFPYRPFHLNLDYARSQSPGLFGLERMKGDVFGIGLNYRGRKVKDLQLSYRRGVSSQGGEKEIWSISRLAGSHRFSTTDTTFDASHQEFGVAGGGVAFKSDTLELSTRTPVSKQWEIRTSATAADIAGRRSADASANLTGRFGAWTSQSSLGLRTSGTGEAGAKSESVSESLLRSAGRFSAFGAVALSAVQIPSLGTSSKRETFLLGGSYNLSKAWRVSGDVGLSSGGGQLAGTASTQNTESFHVAVSEGGEVPELLRHTLYFMSDLDFERRVRDDYPPGYVPTELATQMIQRRIRQSGGLSFSGDFWHIQAKGGGGHLDWAKFTGSLKVGPNLRLLGIGDWRRDASLALAGVRQDDKNLSLNGSYSLGLSSLSASVGYAKNQQHTETTGTVNRTELPQGANATSASTLFYSAGFSSRAWMIPYNVVWTRYDAGQGVPTTAISTNASLHFRKISLRLGYEIAQRPGEFRSRRITVDLLRLFDTISFWGIGR